MEVFLSSRLWQQKSPVKVKRIYPGRLSIDFSPPLFWFVNKQPPVFPSKLDTVSSPVWVFFPPSLAFWLTRPLKCLYLRSRLSAVLNLWLTKDFKYVSLAGCFGIFWYMFWILVSYESPADHPSITDEERVYIEESIGESAKLMGPSEVRRHQLGIKTAHKNDLLVSFVSQLSVSIYKSINF